MRIGTIAYATPTGLGHQSREFVRMMNPSKVLLVDLNQYNKINVDYSWYKGSRVCIGIPSIEDCEWLTDNVDLIFVCETPLNIHLFEIARRKGVVTIQQPNPEFLDYFRHPEWSKPDLLGMPTTWMWDKVKELGIRMEYLEVPVNRDLVEFRQIDKCKSFFHIIGRPAVNDRNGTLQFLKAAKRIGDKFDYIIYYQTPTDQRAIEYFEPVRQAIEETKKVLPLRIYENTESMKELYEVGDVLVLPRKYGGNCLPMREALSAGIPVLMPDISPNRDYLDINWLFKAHLKGTFFAHTDVEYYESEVDDLVRVMNKFESDGFMKVSNKMADTEAFKLGWDFYKPVYESLFQSLIEK